MKDFFKKLFSAGDEVSSKRFIGFIAFTLIVFSFVLSLFKEVFLPEYIFEGMLFIVLGAFLGGTIEKFSRKAPKNCNDEECWEDEQEGI